MPASARRPKARDAILDATAHLLCDRGFEATTIDEIIERSGVARGTFYYNFPGKCAAVHALLRREFHPLAERIERELAEASVVRAFETLAAGMADWYRGNPNLAGAMVRCSHDEHGMPPPAGPASGPASEGSFRGFLERLAAEGQRRGELRSDVPVQALALMFTGLMMQGMTLWVQDSQAALHEHWPQHACAVFLAGAARDGGER